MASLKAYRCFVDDLLNETGISAGSTEEGSIYLALSETKLNDVRRRYEWQRGAGLRVEFLDPREVRRREPLVTVPLLGALFFPDDLQVVPRLLLRALHEACIRRGVDIQAGVRVDAVSRHRVLVGEEELRARSVIVASGVWSPEIGGLDPSIPLRPRKGQILSLQTPGRSFRHMLRWEHAYFVPRPNGELVVGATDEDVGFDRSLTPEGLGLLLAEAQRISSHVASYPIQEMWTGLRPASPDSLPIIGPSRVPGVFYATGHYRNGILLAPITASIIAALVEGREPPVAIEAYRPERFG
jgi:glycine oxidase